MFSLLGERLSALSTLALIASQACAVCRVSLLFCTFSLYTPEAVPHHCLLPPCLHINFFLFLNKKGQWTGNSNSDLASASNQVWPWVDHLGFLFFLLHSCWSSLGGLLGPSQLLPCCGSVILVNCILVSDCVWLHGSNLLDVGSDSVFPSFVLLYLTAFQVWGLQVCVSSDRGKCISVIGRYFVYPKYSLGKSMSLPCFVFTFELVE